VEAAIECTLASLRAMEGHFDEARATYRRAHAAYDECGLHYMRAACSLGAGSVELLAGDVDAAVHELRAGYGALERMGERGTRSTIAAFLAQALVAQGEYAEAEGFARIAEETGAAADVVTQSVWRSARGRCLAHAGALADAERLARDAVELAATTDFLDLQARTLLDLAEVLALAGRVDEVPILIAAARKRYERKGNVVAAEQTMRAVAAAGDPA
jgi:ATP/maltotriose-dependent transcriptional regulator MalT